MGTRDAEKKRLLAQIVLAQAEGGSAVGEETEKLRLQARKAQQDHINHLKGVRFV